MSDHQPIAGLNPLPETAIAPSRRTQRRFGRGLMLHGSDHGALQAPRQCREKTKVNAAGTISSGMARIYCFPASIRQ